MPLAGDQRFQPSRLALEVARYARQKGVRWVFWPTMGHSDPWSGRGRQLRPDMPDWTMIQEGPDAVRSKPAACFGYRPFYEWLIKVNLEAMDAGRYGAWCMDGDFHGGAGFGGGRSSSVHPARCHSELHDHVRPDIDYIMLSALSSSPNQTYYLPSQAGIPAEDKLRIKKWLDWARDNIDYVMVRKDLPNWPAAGRVDGSAHIVGDRGLVFLFNPNRDPLRGEFALTEQSIGLKRKGEIEVSQDFPESDRSIKVLHGETVYWKIPGETAVVLKVQPVDQ